MTEVHLAPARGIALQFGSQQHRNHQTTTNQPTNRSRRCRAAAAVHLPARTLHGCRAGIAPLLPGAALDSGLPRCRGGCRGGRSLLASQDPPTYYVDPVERRPTEAARGTHITEWPRFRPPGRSPSGFMSCAVFQQTLSTPTLPLAELDLRGSKAGRPRGFGNPPTIRNAP